MSTQSVHTLVLGAGPAGLTAGYKLASDGIKPVVIERSKYAGGLMRSFQHGDFTLDIGRKELYSRIPEVDEFWTRLLGEDYRTYQNRVGVLFEGHIIELSLKYRGYRRGMPWSMFLSCILDYMTHRVKPISADPQNFQEHLAQRGQRKIHRIMSVGYKEKFGGSKWMLREAPDISQKSNHYLEKKPQKKRIGRIFTIDDPNAERVVDGVWRHPSRGTGQIVEWLEQQMVQRGGNIHFGEQVESLERTNGKVSAVKARRGSETITYLTENVIASVPCEVLLKLINSAAKQPAPSLNGKSMGKRSVILVYLFLDEAPMFPHTHLKVTCPQMKAGRITNYAAFNGDMIPSGQTCLCIEYFCEGSSDILALPDEGVAELAIQECADAGLIHKESCFDTMVIQLPHTDAATDWRDWHTPTRQQQLEEIQSIENLYFVSRPGTDWSTYAGLMAAEAIVSGDRRNFDKLTDPTKNPSRI